MKISHSIIVLTSIIFVSGSMITVGMDVKRTTNDVSTNVIEAKQKHNERKEIHLHGIKSHEKEMDTASNSEQELSLEKDKMNKQKAVYKLKSLNQQNPRSTNKFL